MVRNEVEPSSIFDYSNINLALLSFNEQSSFTSGDSNPSFHPEMPSKLHQSEFLTNTGLHMLQGKYKARPSSAKSECEVYPAATSENTRLLPVNILHILDVPDGTMSTQPIFNKQYNQ
uniref:Uncharacterized protein n=1 Tax=Moniliophthora roreri TaxID=221103 RepID=A0A0W0F9G9_MONRR